MMIAQVIGTVVSTQKEPTMDGLRLLVCQPVNAEGEKAGATVVAADAVGAGVGEMILYATGSSARQTDRDAKSAGRCRRDGDRRPLGSRRRDQVSQE